MQENKDNRNKTGEETEQLSLNDDRRVQVLSPGTLVAKRFFRNRLAIVGLSVLVVMFVFSFLGGAVSPHGQDELFYRVEYMNKEYVGVSENNRAEVRRRLQLCPPGPDRPGHPEEGRFLHL